MMVAAMAPADNLAKVDMFSSYNRLISLQDKCIHSALPCKGAEAPVGLKNRIMIHGPKLRTAPTSSSSACLPLRSVHRPVLIGSRRSNTMAIAPRGTPRAGRYLATNPQRLRLGQPADCPNR